MTRDWTAQQTKSGVIRLMCNGVHLASVIYKNDCGGDGWRVNPMSPNHPRSRRSWPTPSAAVKQYGKDAVAAIAAVAG